MILFIVAIVTAICIWTAKIARKASSDNLEQFKRLNASLDSSNEAAMRRNDSAMLQLKH